MQLRQGDSSPTPKLQNKTFVKEAIKPSLMKRTIIRCICLEISCFPFLKNACISQSDLTDALQAVTQLFV
jgi:hypothetical protein